MNMSSVDDNNGTYSPAAHVIEWTQQFADFANSTSSNGTSPPAIIESPHFCKWILYKEIGETRVRIWDWIILVPNICFLLFLLVRAKMARQRLRASTSPIFGTFYLLVVINVTTSVARCIISMSVNATSSVGGTTDKVFWVFVRFFLLSTEISVLVFGLAFGHLDSRTSIRRVLLVTSTVALAYSLCQGTLEMIAPDENYYVHETQTSLYSHGGTLFWAVTCFIFSMVYLLVFVLPYTPCRRRIPLPSKKSFYLYSLTLSVVNMLQALGSIVFYYKVIEGLCIIDVTTYLYFTFFTPFVYWTFLSSFFSPQASVVMFSYKSQIDDGLDDPVGDGRVGSGSGQLPHQLSCSSIRTDADDFVYQQNESLRVEGAAGGRGGGEGPGGYKQLVASSSFSPESVRSMDPIS